MRDFSASDVAFTGFRFVREHPRTVAIWAAIQLTFSLLMGLAMVFVFRPFLDRMHGLSAAGPPNPAGVPGLMAAFLPIWFLGMAFVLGLYAVVYAAMARAVLQPDQERFAYLRLGGDELRQMLMQLLFCALAIGAYIVVLMAVGIVFLLVSLVARAAGPLAYTSLAIGIVGAWIYLLVRLSLASPLTFDRGRVDVLGSWGLTRGRFWKLLGAYLLATTLAAVACLLLFIVVLAAAAILGGGFSGITAFLKSNTSSPSAEFSPLSLVVDVIEAVGMALILPVVLMPASAIYQAIAPPESASVD